MIFNIKTKKTACAAISALLLFALITLNSHSVFADNGISVHIDDTPISFENAPYIENGRTMVPMRVIFESLGASVEWDDATQSVTAVYGSTAITLTIGDYTLYKNGEALTLDAAPRLVSDTTYVPLRAVSEAFGYEVLWSDAQNRVDILTGGDVTAVYDCGYGNVPDFGTLFNISPVYVLENNTIYAYSASDIPSGAEAQYAEIMAEYGFSRGDGNGYDIYLGDGISVLVGVSGEYFRIVITPY